MSKLTVHIAEPNEWKKFRKLRISAVKSDPTAWNDTLKETENRDEVTWKNWLKEPYVFAIEFADKFISSVTLRKEKETGQWIINGVWTDPAFRRQGLSKKIFENVFKKARNLDIDSLELTVNMAQTPAIKLYESLGFKIIKTINSEKEPTDSPGCNKKYVMKITL